MGTTTAKNSLTANNGTTAVAEKKPNTSRSKTICNSITKTYKFR